MSFAGSLGFVMDGSGIESVFKTVYAKALRPHILLESALTIKLLQILFNDDKENTILTYV